MDSTNPPRLGTQGLEKKMKAVMVKNNNGFYESIGAAAVEDWDDVQAAADAVERIDGLTGWGEYTASYKVEANGAEFCYFVAEHA